MKVIFVKDLRGQGKVNDIKEVADGYAMNFLIKNGYAVKYTKASSDILERDMQNAKEKEASDIKTAKELEQKLLKEKIEFEVKKGENGKIFGSVSSKQIVDELVKRGYSIQKKQISLREALSSLGYHDVKIELHKKVVMTLKVNLRAK